MREVHIQIVRAIAAYQFMGNRSCSVGEIQKLCKYSRQHINREAKELVKRGLITQYNLPVGKRNKWHYYLAPSGIELLYSGEFSTDIKRQGMLF